MQTIDKIIVGDSILHQKYDLSVLIFCYSNVWYSCTTTTSITTSTTHTTTHTLASTILFQSD